MLMKYRKLPVEIDAIQFDGTKESGDQIIKWAKAMGGRKIWWNMPAELSLTIDTIEGQMEAISGDFIIRGVVGEFYPCKPDIFAKTYEPV